MALCCAGGVAACGDDGGSSASSTTTAPTTTTAPATSATGDLGAQVDAFCAQTEALQQLMTDQFEIKPPPPDGEEQINSAIEALVPVMIELQMLQGQMLPGDAARYQECAETVGGAPTPAG